MTYILTADGRDQDAIEQFRLYRKYLDSVKGVFPPSAFALATSDWYYGPIDHRSPHDAWLETVCFTENARGLRNEIRNLSLNVRLLGAYQDGYVELRYPIVFAYQFSISDCAKGHRDWRYDEFRLSDRGNLIHQIEWSGRSGNGHWIIEAADLEFRWVPKSADTAAAS